MKKVGSMFSLFSSLVIVALFLVSIAVSESTVLEAPEDSDILGNQTLAWGIYGGSPDIACGDGIVDAGEECDDGNTYNNDGCSAECDIEEPVECGTDAYFSVDFISVENNGSGNLYPKIYVGDNPIPYDAGDLIPLSSGGYFIVDDSFVEDVDGISVQRKNGEIKFLLYGSHDDGSYERLRANINFYDASITDYTNDPYKAETFPNKPNAMDPKDILNYSGSYAYWKSNVMPANDGFFLSLECGELCGNGIIDAGEECDDGNTDDGDGCSSDCEIEVNDICGGADYIFEWPDPEWMVVIGDGCFTHPTIGITDSKEINISSHGEYRAFVTSVRGQPSICQYQPDESFFIEINGANSSVSSDTVTASDGCSDYEVRDEDMGVFPFDSGLNTVFMHTASQCPPSFSPNSVEVVRLCLFREARCGDNVVDAGEECDDGNTDDGDGCSSDCEIEECGDDVLQLGLGEECELPDTTDNSYCSQKTEDCDGMKLGLRDESGDCDPECGCVEDDFEYSCVLGECGAECEANVDCAENECSVTYDDYCDGLKLVEYDDDMVFDSTLVEDSCDNTCESDCGCTDCSVDCSPPETNEYCVYGVCGAECDSDDDCDDGDPLTDDSCFGNCSCNHVFIGECTDDNDCNDLDADYCDGNLIMHDEGICVDNMCEVNTTTDYDCDDDDYSETSERCEANNHLNVTVFHDYSCRDAECVEVGGGAGAVLIENCTAKSTIRNDCGLEEWICSEDDVVGCVVEDVIPIDDYCSDICSLGDIYSRSCDEQTYDCELDVLVEECNDVNYCNGTIDVEEEWDCDYVLDVPTCILGDKNEHECLDGAWCNGQETCNAGECIDGVAVDCSDGNECTDDVCNENTDSCENPNFALGTLCGESRDCPDDSCNDVFAKLYPDDGHDACDGSGSCVEYSCVMEDTYCSDDDEFDGVDSVECGAECDQDADCADNECSETYNDYCNGLKLVEYDADLVFDSTLVEDSCDNSCESDCGCTDCSVDCSAPSTNEYCVYGACGAECDSDDDCDDGDPLTDDSCFGNCSCNHVFIGECLVDANCDDLDADYCDGSLIVHDEGICVDSICEVNTTTEFDCNDYDGDYCNANIVETRDFTCEEDVEPECEYDVIDTEDCDSYDNWNSGGDTPGYGQDPACEYDDYSCVDDGLDDECRVTRHLVEDFDYLDDEPLCFDPRIGKTDYFCDLGSCDDLVPENGCSEDSEDYINGCDIDCGAQCEIDDDCDDQDEHTLDTCNLDECSCEHEELPYCGDGNVDDSEECDDGNNANGDGCDENCMYEREVCGDNFVEGSEECELPGDRNNIYCVQSTEECLGNKLGTRDAFGNCDCWCGCDYDDFEYSCVEGECGAECDSDDDCDGGVCLDDCSCYKDRVCGDGVIDYDLGEQCDDGNNVDGDGCSAECEIECVDADYIYDVDMLVWGVNCFGSNHKPTDSESIDVPIDGKYALKGVAYRGNPGQCQVNEAYYIEVDGDDGAVAEDDVDACAISVRLDDLGEFNFDIGMNDVIMHTASECPPDYNVNSVEVDKLCLYKIEEPDMIIKDSKVAQAMPDSNFGLGRYMMVNPKAQGSDRSYLRIDISDLSDETVSSADLNIAVYYTGSNVVGKLIDAYYCADHDFFETEINWINQPFNDSCILADTYNVTNTVIAGLPETWHSFDIADEVNKELSEDGLFTIVLKARDEGTVADNSEYVQYLTKDYAEEAFRPKLDIS